MSRRSVIISWVAGLRIIVGAFDRDISRRSVGTTGTFAQTPIGTISYMKALPVEVSWSPSERVVRVSRRTGMEHKVEQVLGEKIGTGPEALNMYLLRVRRHRILSRREEAALAARIQQRDGEAWEELVSCNLKLVVS